MAQVSTVPTPLAVRPYRLRRVSPTPTRLGQVINIAVVRRVTDPCRVGVGTRGMRVPILVIGVGADPGPGQGPSVAGAGPDHYLRERLERTSPWSR